MPRLTNSFAARTSCRSHSAVLVGPEAINYLTRATAGVALKRKMLQALERIPQRSATPGEGATLGIVVSGSILHSIRACCQ